MCLITKALAAAAALPVALAIMSCGGDGSERADAAAIEQELSDGIPGTIAIGGPKNVKVDSVDCPDDLTVEAGAVYECTVSHSIGGLGETAEVEIDEDAQYAYFSIPVTDAAAAEKIGVDKGDPNLSGQIGTSGEPE